MNSFSTPGVGVQILRALNGPIFGMIRNGQDRSAASEFRNVHRPYFIGSGLESKPVTATLRPECRRASPIACDCLGEGDADSVLRSQDDHWARFDRLARNHLEIVFSEQNAQNHEDLQHGVITADTAPRPSSEGQMGEGRVKLLIRFAEALRVEGLRVPPVLGSMVHAVNEHYDRRPAGDGEIPCMVV